jgi:hypothetical protein
MVTREQLTTWIAATLTTLAETENSCSMGVPESHLYLAVSGGDIHHWNGLKGILIHNDWITCQNNLVRITPKGRELAEKIEAQLATAGR